MSSQDPNEIRVGLPGLRGLRGKQHRMGLDTAKPYEDRERDTSEEYDEDDTANDRSGINNINHGMRKPVSLEDLQADFTNAQVAHDQEMKDIYHWRKVLKNKPGLKRKDRSRYTSRLTRTQAEWVYPDISEPFMANPDLFDVSAQTGQDNDIATQDGTVLNKQIDLYINRSRLLDKLAHVLVDDGTAILVSGWDRKFITEYHTEPVYEYYPITDPTDPVLEKYQHIAKLHQNNLPLPPHNEELIAGYRYSHQNGATYKAKQVGTKEVPRDKLIKNAPTLEVMHYDDVYIDPNAYGNIDDAQFVVFKKAMSLSDMKKQYGRYHNLDRVKEDNTSYESTISDGTTDQAVNIYNYKDKNRRLHDAYEYWGYGDIEGTGITTLFVCTWIDNVVVRLEKHPIPEIGLPVAIVQYMPEFRQNAGTADAELTEPSQKNVTAVTRGILDLLAKSANGQRAFRDNSLDLVNKRKFLTQQDFSFRSDIQDPRQIFHTFQYPDISPSVWQFVRSQQRDAEVLSGTQPFGSEGNTRQNESVQGIRNILDATSKRRMSILRRVSEGLTVMANHIIAMNRQYLTDYDVQLLTDTQVVDRTGKNPSVNIKIDVSTPEHSDLKAKELAFILQTEGNDSDPMEKRMVKEQIARLRGLHDFADKIRDFQPQPDPAAEKIKQLQIQLLEAQIQNELGKAHENRANGEYDLARVNVEHAKVMTEQAKATKLKAEAEALDLDFIEQSTGTHQERQKELAILNHLTKQQQGVSK